MRLLLNLADFLLMAVTRYVENPANPPETHSTDGT